jgi:hypothetical protein
VGFRFQPDLPPDTPDTWRVCDGWHADRSGVYRTGWTAAAISAVSAVGAGVTFQNGFCYRTAAGTQGALLLAQVNVGSQKAYVWNGGWNDRSGTFTNLTDVSMLQVGNITLVSPPGGTIIQRDASGTGNFANVGGSPAGGALAVNALNITVVLDTTTDAWAASDIASPTVYSGGEAASGNLRLVPGNNTACVALGNDVYAFKERGVMRGSYVGGVVKWTWQLVDGNRGAWGPWCAIEAEGRIYFIGRSGFYSFDGSTFQRIDDGIWTTLLSILGTSSGPALYNYRLTKLVYDSITQTIGIFQQGTISSGARNQLNAFFTYNIISGKWGYQSAFADKVADTIYGVFNVAVFNDYKTTGTPSYSTDFGFISSTNDRIEALSTTFSPSTVGTNLVPKLRTFRLGARDRMTTVTRFIPNWTLCNGIGTDLSTATLKTCTPHIADAPIASMTTQSAVTLSTNLYRADYTKMARFQDAELQLDCEAAIDGGQFVYKQTALE